MLRHAMRAQASFPVSVLPESVDAVQAWRETHGGVALNQEIQNLVKSPKLCGFMGPAALLEDLGIIT